MKNFQIIITVIFIALAIFGIFVFSGAIPIGGKDAPGSLGTVVLWGTANTAIMSPLLEEFNALNTTFIVRYVQKSTNSFDQELLEALASGVGPDLIFLPDDLAFHYANKIFAIPYTSYPLNSFKTNFASAGEVFLTSKGILAMPVTIDPLLMYYNRSILDANAVVFPPATWDDLTKLVPTLTKKDETDRITKSTVALGHFANVDNAKDILSALFMQTGNPIVSEKDGLFTSSLYSPAGRFDISNILKFYTDFADPNNEVYSWNRSFSSSKESFSKEDLAFYFGFASEIKSLVNRNPNQNFSIASFPQIKNSKFKLTGSHVTGVAVLASSKNLPTAVTVANLLSSSVFASKFANAQGVAPARRDLLANKPQDAFSPIFYSSALYAKSWVDPSSKGTDDIFRNMIDAIISNTMNPSSAIADANSKMGFLLNK